MDQNKKLSLATKLCKRKDFIFRRINFQQLYSTTTENIDSYIDFFDLKDKSLLTVGSSGDQALNAILRDCKDITILDKSPFSEEFFYLKKTALLHLDREELLKLFSLYNYPSKGKRNSEAFNNDILNYILKELKDENQEVYEFWKQLLKIIDPKVVRKKLFVHDETPKDKLIKSNSYLQDDKSYQLLRDKVKDVQPKFITADIRKVVLDDDYDNIFLSNIFDYIIRREALYTLNNVLPHLKENGKILLYYLYSITLSEEIPSIDELYDPNYVLRYLPIESELYDISSIEERTNYQRDGVIIYQKRRNK